MTIALQYGFTAGDEGMSRRKRRIPKLTFTANRGIGWHVSYRDAESGTPRRFRFGLVNQTDKAEAERRYSKWLAGYLNGQVIPASSDDTARKPATERLPASFGVAIRSGSLIDVANGFLDFQESRVRDPDSPRASGTIHPDVFRYRTHYVREFLKFINSQHGRGAAARLRVSNLTMQEVEAYNRNLVERGLSAATVTHAMQVVRQLVIRAGRPEHGQQVLSWNWDSRDHFSGRAKRARSLPTLNQLQRMLVATDLQGRAMIWTAIGLGFGARDLSKVRVGLIDAEGYDLRRSKTGIARYGKTPPRVWVYLDRLIRTSGKSTGDLVFRSATGLPLVSGRVDRVNTWWGGLREKIGESKDTMSGFYVLRHLGATEYGSRPSCSLSEMRSWLGHATSSAMADVYMRPVAPEHRELVMWVRDQLASADEVEDRDSNPASQKV